MILLNLKFCWHDWLKPPIIQNVRYFGKTIPEAKEGDLRVCQKCGKVQEIQYFSDGGKYWETLDFCKEKVALEVIQRRKNAIEILKNDLKDCK